MSSVASTMFYAIWSMFAGFLIMKPKIPGWWIWYYYLCPGAYQHQLRCPVTRMCVDLCMCMGRLRCKLTCANFAAT